jgi:chemotaxis protein MotB
VNRKRKHGAHANHERWLVSYADFITLLFAFFVVLYASSQVDKAKMNKLSVAIEGAFKQMGVFNKNGTAAPNENPVEDNESSLEHKAVASTGAVVGASTAAPTPEMNQQGFTKSQMRNMKRELEQLLAAEIKRREVALHIGPEGLVVSLREMGFFDSGSSSLKPGSEAALERIVMLLREKDAEMRVEGHTDNVPIHTVQFNSNWELSTARATEIIKLLIAKYGFPPDRLSAAGYGEFHPVADNANAEGRRQNRRLDLVILAAPGQDASRVRGGNEVAISETTNNARVSGAGSAAH